MKMNKRFTREQGLYLLALGLALLVRLLGLGAAPLSDYEARWALGALQVAQKAAAELADPSIGHNPVYTFLTAALFSLFRSGEFTARTWSAIIGASLVVGPYFVRRRLGSTPAIILAYGLALDPGLTAAARMAGGPVFALTFGAWAWIAYANKWRARAAILLGLFLLSGTAALHAAFILGLTLLAGRLLSTRDAQTQPQEPGGAEVEREPSFFFRRSDWIVLAGTILLVGTAFAAYPAGLGAFTGAIPAYLSGWLQASWVPAIQLLIVLIASQPLAAGFGLVGLWMGRRDQSVQLAGVMAIIALVLALLYPARQIVDLVWVLLPLWYLAARGIWEITDGNLHMDWITWIQAGLIFILAIMFGLNLAGLSRTPQGQAATFLLLVLLGLVVVGVITSILVGLGWSWKAARKGAGVGLLTGLFLSVLASLSGVMYFSSQPEDNQAWSIPPVAGDIRLFEDTLEQLSLWQTGQEREVDVVATVDSASMKWALRDYPRARFATLAQIRSLDEPPSIVITQLSDSDPSLASSYRGQDFAWWLYPLWNPALPLGISGWMNITNPLIDRQQVILWAQADMFPGEFLASEAAQEPFIELESQPGD